MKVKGGLSWPPENVEEKNTMFNAAISVHHVNLWHSLHQSKKNAF